MKMKGRAWVFGDNIDTDVIIPARYLNIRSSQELSQYLMEDIEPGFSKRVKKGDIIIAGENFGCGSSREHAPSVIKASGISCVIASSFARIFYRNAINIGLKIMVSKEASQRAEQGDEFLIDYDKGIIENITKGEKYKSEVFPDFLKEIIKAGGLLDYGKGNVKSG